MSNADHPMPEARRTRCAIRMAAVAAALLAIGRARWTLADEPDATTYASAADASDALFRAVHDRDAHALRAVLGAGDELTSCGDESMDRLEHERFLQKYQEMHRLVREPDGATVLYVGAENWPFPVPLVSEGERWRFDDAGGRREVTFRRIGANEATAIEVSRAVVEAVRRDGAAGDDPIVSYAASLVRDARARGGEASAASGAEPFHGYRFLVRPQKGALTVVAFPAEYRASGVMTFVAGPNGVVRERDLGPDTSRIAPTLTARSVSGWHAGVA